MKKVLLVVTSYGDLGNTGKKTGYYLPEVSHPYYALLDKGFEVDIASPQGGLAPMDERSRDAKDPLNQRFLNDASAMKKLENTLRVEQLDPKSYGAVLYAGGHGTMWDFANNTALNRLSSTVYENQGVVAAVCHGPAALVGLKLSNGKFLVDGKQLTAFSNAEEEGAGLTQVVPFLLENELVKQGAQYSKADLWKEKVVVSERLVTGQNPASARGVGEAVALLLS